MMCENIHIAPSILSADFRFLERDVKAVEKAGATMIHCDVMDGTFVPNISFGPLVIGAVKKSVSIPLDVHLMIVHPEKYIPNFKDSGADIITVHAEACENLPEVISCIKDSGAKVGVAVNPDKPVDLFLPYLNTIDLVLIMSVYAGFGGQKFMPEIVSKIAAVYKEAALINKDLIIEVDGGITDQTVGLCSKNGANAFVAGSYIFNGTDYTKPISNIRARALQGIQERKL